MGQMQIIEKKVEKKKSRALNVNKFHVNGLKTACVIFQFKSCLCDVSVWERIHLCLSGIHLVSIKTSGIALLEQNPYQSTF